MSLAAPEKPSRTHWAILILILLIGATLRLIYLNASEAHIDEIWHMELSTGRGSAHETLPMNVLIDRAPSVTSLDSSPGWLAIPGSLDQVTHPPLFYLILRPWRAVIGESLRSARLLSAILSVLCVAALFDVVRQMFPTRIALWAALLLAASSAQIEVGQEVRQYPLLTLLCLIAAGALVRIERTGFTRRQSFALILALLATLFTHYFALPFALMFLLYVLIRFRGKLRWQTAGAIVLPVILFAILWGPRMLRQSHAFAVAAGPAAIHDESPTHVADTFWRLAIEPIRQLFEPWPRTAVISLMSASLFVIPFFLLRRSPMLLLWTFWLIVGTVFTTVLDLLHHTRQLELIRYTILAGPAVCVLLPAMLASYGPQISNAFSAIIAFACFAALGLTYTRYNQPFTRVGYALANTESADLPVVFYSDPSERFWSQWLYLGTSHYSQTFPRPAAILDHPPDDQLLAQLHRWPMVWVVWSDTHEVDINSDLLPGSKMIRLINAPRLGSAALVEWVTP